MPSVDTKPGMSTVARPLWALPPLSGAPVMWTGVHSRPWVCPGLACSALFLLMASVAQSENVGASCILSPALWVWRKMMNSFMSCFVDIGIAMKLVLF